MLRKPLADLHCRVLSCLCKRQRLPQPGERRSRLTRRRQRRLSRLERSVLSERSEVGESLLPPIESCLVRGLVRRQRLLSSSECESQGAVLHGVDGLLGGCDGCGGGLVDAVQRGLRSGDDTRRGVLGTLQRELGGADRRFVREVVCALQDALRSLERGVCALLRGVQASKLRPETDNGDMAGIVPRETIVVIDLALNVVDLVLQAVDLALEV